MSLQAQGFFFCSQAKQCSWQGYDLWTRFSTGTSLHNYPYSTVWSVRFRRGVEEKAKMLLSVHHDIFDVEGRVCSKQKESLFIYLYLQQTYKSRWIIFPTIEVLQSIVVGISFLLSSLGNNHPPFVVDEIGGSWRSSAAAQGPPCGTNTLLETTAANHPPVIDIRKYKICTWTLIDMPI